jgi:hypothetical protein
VHVAEAERLSMAAAFPRFCAEYASTARSRAQPAPRPARDKRPQRTPTLPSDTADGLAVIEALRLDSKEMIAG